MARVEVFYDGGCPLCRREIAFYRRRDARARIVWTDVAASAGSGLPAGLTREAALARLHVRRADGRMVSGAAGFAAIWRALPGFALAGRLIGQPPLLWLAEGGYRVFLRLRPLWRKPRACARDACS